jgi:hypothetical protein
MQSSGAKAPTQVRRPAPVQRRAPPKTTPVKTPKLQAKKSEPAVVNKGPKNVLPPPKPMYSSKGQMR